MTTHPFIAVEGLDGTGKTTLRKGLFRLWQGLFDVTPLCVLTTNFLLAEQAPAVIDGKYQPTPENRDAYLSAIIADKNATLDRLVRPHLHVRPVIADRWLISELAFFAVKHGAPAAETYKALAAGMESGPAATLVLELPPADSMERARSRSGDATRPDWDVHHVQSAVHQVYADVTASPQSFPLLGHIVRLDGSRTPAQVLRSAWIALEQLGLMPALTRTGGNR